MRRPLSLLLLAVTGPFSTGSVTGAMTVWCVGDSITWGKSSPADVPGGYRGALNTLLGGAGKPAGFVGLRADNSAGLAEPRHDGWPGYRIDEIGRAVRAMPAGTQADVVLLLAGTNDVRQGFALAEVPARLEALAAELARLQPRAWVLVGSLPPLRADPKHPQQVAALEAFNRLVPDIVARCAARGLRVGFADIHAALGRSDISVDTVHPTAAGYVKIARAWFAAIERAPPPG
jgi:lysophospholipase L1-like esterase